MASIVLRSSLLLLVATNNGAEAFAPSQMMTRPTHNKALLSSSSTFVEEEQEGVLLQNDYMDYLKWMGEDFEELDPAKLLNALSADSLTVVDPEESKESHGLVGGDGDWFFQAIAQDKQQSSLSSSLTGLQICDDSKEALLTESSAFDATTVVAQAAPPALSSFQTSVAYFADASLIAALPDAPPILDSYKVHNSQPALLTKEKVIREEEKHNSSPVVVGLTEWFSQAFFPNSGSVAISNKKLNSSPRPPRKSVATEVLLTPTIPPSAPSLDSRTIYKAKPTTSIARGTSMQHNKLLAKSSVMKPQFVPPSLSSLDSRTIYHAAPQKAQGKQEVNKNKAFVRKGSSTSSTSSVATGSGMPKPSIHSIDSRTIVKHAK